MKKTFYNLMLLVALLFMAVCQVGAQTMPTLSTTGSDVWYYIQFKNSGAVFEDSKATVSYSAATIMKTAALVANSDAQLWKIEAKPGGGYYITSKLGNKINYTSAPISKYHTDQTGVALYIYPTLSTTYTNAFEISRTTTFLTFTGTYSMAPYAGTGVGYYMGNEFSGKESTPLVFVPAANISDLLANTISAATTKLTLSKEGTRPGQFTTQSRNALQAAITTAQGASASVNAVATLQTAITTYNSSVIIPTISTASDNWYYIQGDRNYGDAFITSKGAGQNLTTAPLDLSDSQLWKLVPNTTGPATGYALVNKATGQYLNTNSLATDLATQSTMPKRNLAIVSTNQFTGDAYRFWIQNTVGDSLVPARLQAAYIARTATAPDVASIKLSGGIPYDKTTWMFVDYLQALQLKVKAASDYAKLNSDGFGKRAASDAADLLNTIESAQGIVDGSSSIEDCKLGCQALDASLELFNQAPINRNLSELVSTDPDNYKWYWIRNYATQVGYSFGKVISEGDRTVGGKYTYEEKTATPSDKQLFRFELSADGTKVLNIIDKLGNYLAPSGAIAATAIVGSDFEITALSDSVAFWIKPKDQNPIHAAAGNAEIMNWDEKAGSASAWVFDFAFEDSKVPYDPALALAALLTTINTTTTHLNETSDGFGKHTIAQGAKLRQLIADAQAVYNRTGSRDECAAAIKNINKELIVFDASPVVSNISNLLSTESKYKWYWIRSNASAVPYCYKKVMSSGTRTLNQKFTYEDKVVPGTDNQLFRFELSADQTSVVSIIDKNGNYLGPNGQILAASTSGKEFAITLLEDNTSFWIKATDEYPIHAADIGDILNWEAGVGSASAWVFDLAAETAKPTLTTPRTVTVNTANTTMGTAIITGTTTTTVTTNNLDVFVTAIPARGYLFLKWTSVSGDSVSSAATYNYKGTRDTVLVANFIKGFYRPMKRKYMSSNPTSQQAERYLLSTSYTVGTAKTTVFSGVTANPNPIDPSVTSGQVIDNALIDYTASPIMLPVGTTAFDLNCVGYTGPNGDDLQWTQQVAFIDWNQNFNFVDENEITTGSDDGAKLIDPLGFTRTITLPADLAQGSYRMRVVYYEGSGWEKSLWATNVINNGVAYDFTIQYGTNSDINDHIASNIKIFVKNGKLTVVNAEGGLLNICDVTGKIMSTTKVSSSAQEFALPAAKGMYIATVKVGGIPVTTKFIK